jgi:hypothetical protein
MEFILQLLAELFIPLEEEDKKAVMHQTTEADATEVGPLLAEEQQLEDPNIFGIMEFH